MHTLDFDQFAQPPYLDEPIAQIQSLICHFHHRTLPLAGPVFNCARSSGFIGNELILTPRPPSACSTAAATAGATPTVPNSPTPLKPYGFPWAGAPSTPQPLTPP